MSLVFQMSAQMAELLQVHFTSVKLVLFDLFSLIDHKFAGGKWAHGFVHVCSFCERDPRQQSKKPAPDFLKVFPLPSAAVILTRGTFFLGCSLQDKKKKKNQSEPLIAMHQRNIHEAASAVSLFNISNCRLLSDWCVTERRRGTRWQSDLPRFTQHARRSDTLCCPQIILSCRVFPTGLITCVAAKSRREKKKTKHTPAAPRLCPLHFSWAVRHWPSPLAIANSNNNLCKGPISRWHVIYHTWPLASQLSVKG